MNAPNKSGWKPAMTADGDTIGGPATHTGNRALMLDEALIFEIGDKNTTGVDLPEPDTEASNRLGGMERAADIGLPGLSEPETVRHYTRLSRQNYAIDLGPVSARQLHHEAQSAAERKSCADARLCRSASDGSRPPPCRARWR